MSAIQFYNSLSIDRTSQDAKEPKLFRSQIHTHATSKHKDEKDPGFDFPRREEPRVGESLSRQEIETLMQDLGFFCCVENEDLPKFMGSDELSGLFDEKEPSLEELKEAFDVFDQNRDGFVDADELQRVLCILGSKEGLDLENCKRMIMKFDKNGDGRIDFKEFVKLMENDFC
ncbi:hypothetical protein ACFE04_006014 [Oxalis oulophora]